MSTIDSTRTVIWALGVNLIIAAMKGTVGAFTGSASMLAEAAHSIADSSTEVFLLIGAAHARRWAKAQYLWALVAALATFGIGGVWAIWDGLDAVFGNTAGSGLAWIGLVVLAGSIALELTSWTTALRTLAATRNGRSWFAHYRGTTDVAAKAVLAEDSLDILGELLAAVGIGLRLLTGSAVFDGAASVLIGLLLTAMAYELGSHNLRLLRTPARVEIDTLALAA